MQITVTIPDEVVSTAESLGLTPERYVEELIAERATISPEQDGGSVDRVAKFEAFLRAITAHSDKIPILPDEAFTRESFYQDHD
jgi:hypothetical protein